MSLSNSIYVLSKQASNLPIRDTFSKGKFEKGKVLGEAYVLSTALKEKLSRLSSSSSRKGKSYQESFAIYQDKSEEVTYSSLVKSITVAQAKREPFTDDYRYVDTRNNARKVSS